MDGAFKERFRFLRDFRKGIALIILLRRKIQRRKIGKGFIIRRPLNIILRVNLFSTKFLGILIGRQASKYIRI